EKTMIKKILDKMFSYGLLFFIGFGFFTHITVMTAVNYYCPIIFQSVGFNLSDALLFTGIVQIAALFSEVIAFFLVDRWGRRPTLLLGIASMIVSLLALSIIYFAGLGGIGGVIAIIGVLVFQI